MSAPNDRHPHRPAAYGGLSIKSCGAQDDLPENNTQAINRADDYALAYALGLRGYDVTLKEPTPSQVAKRIRERDAKKARDAAEVLGKVT